MTAWSEGFQERQATTGRMGREGAKKRSAGGRYYLDLAPPTRDERGGLLADRGTHAPQRKPTLTAHTYSLHKQPGFVSLRRWPCLCTAHTFLPTSAQAVALSPRTAKDRPGGLTNDDATPRILASTLAAASLLDNITMATRQHFASARGRVGILHQLVVTLVFVLGYHS
jgi:hypothetical protein